MPLIGSSPPVRGTGEKYVDVVASARFIPARAGNRPSSSMASRRSSVHPRPCGEQLSGTEGLHGYNGSSPPVRGTETPVCPGCAYERFIPARAGNSGVLPASVRTRSVHPRPCGEQIYRVRHNVDEAGSSPPVRGTVRLEQLNSIQPGFIPARAGNSDPSYCQILSLPVHPRPCGEQKIPLFCTPTTAGSSPPVRGTG